MSKAGTFHIIFSPAGDENIASTRIRINSILSLLQKRGIKYSYQTSFPSLVRANVIFIQKRVTPEILIWSRLAKGLGKVIIYDVDDLGPSLWAWVKPDTFDKTMKLADIVTVGSESQRMILKSDYVKANVVVLPPLIDYYPSNPVRDEKIPRNYLRIIWFGNAFSVPMFEKYIPALSKIPLGQIVAVTDSKSKNRLVQKFPFILGETWSLDNFLNILRSCDLSILMHDGSEYDQAKTNNKMITSINWGIPVIASRTKEYETTLKKMGLEYALFSNSEELTQAIERLRTAEARRKYLDQAQPIIWSEYSPDTITARFIKICTEAKPQSLINRARAIYWSL